MFSGNSDRSPLLEYLIMFMNIMEICTPVVLILSKSHLITTSGTAGEIITLTDTADAKVTLTNDLELL